MAPNHYPYGPPPPPPASSAGSYPYGPPPAYPPVSAPRGGAMTANNSGNSRGGHAARNDYGSQYYQHQQHTQQQQQQQQQQPQAYPPNAGAYGATPQHNYWQGNQQAAHPSAAPPSYPQYPPHQAYAAQPPQGYQPPYQNQPGRPPYGAPYGQPPADYSAQPWAGGGQPPYAQYNGHTGRGGGRGGFRNDQSGHKTENHPVAPPIRMGFDQHQRGDYAPNAPPPYPPNPPPQGAPYGQQPPYSAYPPVPPPVHTPTPPSFRGGGGFGHSGRGRGRDNFGHSNRGRGGHGGGDKFRQNHQNHNGHHRNNNSNHNQDSQKPDHSSTKKKKRKTNTLGLTPGDGEESDTGVAVDDEAHLVEVLGQDVPSIENMEAWIAERKANYPTKKRIEEKKAAQEAKAAEAPAAPKVDSDEAKAEKLRKQLAKVERKIDRQKRKREATDEGDEMRLDSDSSEIKSEDEEPESMPIRKPAPSGLPPPPIIRADPSNHCKYYATGGNCGKKTKCRFKHDPAVRAQALQEQTLNGGKLTLKQRLVLNDKNSEDMETVKAIMNLRSSGKLADPVFSDASAAGSSEPTKAPPATPGSTLPSAASTANLPPIPTASLAHNNSDRSHHKSKNHHKGKGWHSQGAGKSGGSKESS